MTTQEFSDSFDTLVNSFSRDTIFGKENNDVAFNEYEKSVFLTKAQEQLVISLYNGKNSNGESFELSEEIRRYLAPLVVQDTEKPDASFIHTIDESTQGVKLKEDVLFIVYESATLDNSNMGCLPYRNIQVQPITHDEYHRVKNNPFRGASYDRVLRLDSNLGNDFGTYVELISKYPVVSYTYRYIRKPKPIILETLTDGLSLGNNETEAQTSELNTALHDRILELAVHLALQSRNVGATKQ